MTARVLVVDDEPGIRTLLREYLRADGHEVVEAASGAEALACFAEQPVDLVLLDIGLPDMDGLEVLRTLRRTSEVYVIMATARAEELDKLVGLQVGADDYVTKPFSPREVAARVKTVLRRARSSATVEADQSIDVGPLRIDQARREVTRDGHPVALSALQFDLLLAMSSSPGRVWSRRQLLEHVWGGDFFGDERVVDVHIRNLRRVLGDDATSPEIIGTVRGVGYKFLPGV